MIYLAAPYWHEDEKVREWRHNRINEAAALLLLKLRKSIYSPITHNVPLSKILAEKYHCLTGPNKELGHNFWVYTVDFPILRKCDSLAILMLDGWAVSKGVKEETSLAEVAKMEIQYLKPIIVNDEIIDLISINI